MPNLVVLSQTLRA